MEPDTKRASFRDGVVKLGLVSAAHGALQFDISTVQRRVGNQFVESPLCDHNCTILADENPTGGNYNCPAAFTRNRGRITSSAPRADRLLSGIERVLIAAREIQREFMNGPFFEYADRYELPEHVRDAFHDIIGTGPSEVTLFGGSPEAHPDIEEILRGLNRMGASVHLTVTGRRFIRSPGLFDSVVDAGASVLAVSFDDIESVAALRPLLGSSLQELRAAWARVPSLHGQRKKLFEAIHTARLWQELPVERRPGLLFNVALHSGNVDHIDEILTTTRREFPGIRLNPFPLQSAFEYREAEVSSEREQAFADVVGEALEQQLSAPEPGAGRWALVPRAHYWLALKAALACERGLRGVNGWRTWQCYRSVGAGRYVQVAETGRVSDSVGVAGGHLGCFWNSSIDSSVVPAVWDADVGGIRAYLEARPEIVRGHPRPCPGCLFPRLVGDMVSLECGLGPHVKAEYLRLRREHLGF